MPLTLARTFNRKSVGMGKTISKTSVRRILRSMHSPPKWRKLTKWRKLRKAYQHLQKTDAGSLATLNLSILEAFTAQSWDINCIEHVWPQLQNRVSIRRPCTPRGLKEVIPGEWKAIPSP